MSWQCGKTADQHKRVIKYGFFVRSSDKTRIARFKCKDCERVFSGASRQACYRQKKRRLNPRVFELLCSNVSLRRTARLLRINRKTVTRKLLFLSCRAEALNLKSFNKLPLFERLQFDDLETIEHTKCKPLSVTLGVVPGSRQILGFRVSQMPAKGHLAQMAREKYGPRADHRPQAREELFKHLKQKLHPTGLIESDQNPHYVEDVKKWFPQATYLAYLSKRGSIAGQGELKKVVFDPLYDINHTFAMLRANISRLIRKTWCTTKRPDRLKAHIELYVYYHNHILLKNPQRS
jgi:transposase-like protein